MTITFNGASGSRPTVDVTGNLTGQLDFAPSRDTAGLGLSTYIISAFEGTASSVSLQGWTPASGIPMSLIDPLLKP